MMQPICISLSRRRAVFALAGMTMASIWPASFVSLARAQEGAPGEKTPPQKLMLDYLSESLLEQHRPGAEQDFKYSSTTTEIRIRHVYEFRTTGGQDAGVLYRETPDGRPLFLSVLVRQGGFARTSDGLTDDSLATLFGTFFAEFPEELKQAPWKAFLSAPNNNAPTKEKLWASSDDVLESRAAMAYGTQSPWGLMLAVSRMWRGSEQFENGSAFFPGS